MLNSVLFILIVLPFLAALACYIVRVSAIRSAIVIATGGILAIGALALKGFTPFNLTPITLFGLDVPSIIHVADYALLAAMFYIGYRHRNLIIQILSALQVLMLVVFDLFIAGAGNDAVAGAGNGGAALYCDNLSLVMVLIISIVGSLICIYAIPYMKKHEEHLHLAKSRQPQFFAVLIMFLGAMNGLVLAGDLMHFYFFFEVTTLCSFLLIGHDKTEIATKNSVRALWMNSLGGTALLLGIIWIYSGTGTLDIQAILAAKPASAGLLIPIGLLCFSGFTKAAQMPLQSWLLGAMVAPTPTSALLHSSTMVKAGVYLIIRFAPAFAGTFLGMGVALCGAFTFLAGAALAIGQSNGKKVLAYSTVSNLGLIIACAGINTKAAITAAIMLVIFHAVSKALLFLCVGSIEQHIGSRDIEDMRGLFAEMPKTAIIITFGVLTMILPPFGMLLGKWMAIESAADNLFIISMLALGSALTVVYWARWAGVLMGTHYEGATKTEDTGVLTQGPLVALLSIVVILSIAAPFIYLKMIAPELAGEGEMPFAVLNGALTGPAGTFVVLPLFAAMILGGLAYFRFGGKGKVEIAEPYMAGIQGDKVGTYVGPMNKTVKLTYSNYYIENIFGEEKMTPWVNRVAIMLVLLMIGGAL